LESEWWKNKHERCTLECGWYLGTNLSLPIGRTEYSGTELRYRGRNVGTWEKKTKVGTGWRLARSG